MRKLIDRKNWAYVEEEYNQFLDRYAGFGKDVVLALIGTKIAKTSDFKFYKSSGKQECDAFFVFVSKNCEFVLQLDPECEVVVVWDEIERVEFTSWSDDVVQEVMLYLKNKGLEL